MSGHLRFTGFFLWRDSPAGDTGSGNDGGSGKALPPATWVDGSLYVYHGVVSCHPEAGLTYREIRGWAVPGLVDAHCHVGLGSSGPVDRGTQEAQTRADQDAEVLLIHDCDVPVDMRWINEHPELPRIIHRGARLARPKRYLRYLGLELENPHDLPAEVARQTARGDGWVRIVGDWIDRADGTDSGLRSLWNGRISRDAMQAAHEHGARVTVHIFARAAIDDLLDMGVDCMERGTGMDSDHIAGAVRHGVPVTPTMLQIARFADFAARADAKYPVYAATMSAMYQCNTEHQASLPAAGVQLLSDADMRGYQAHGSLPTELARWLNLGLRPAEIVDLATWRARDFLGVPVLSEGAPTDLVVYPCDPRTDIAVLARPALVVLRGESVAGVRVTEL